MKDDTLKRRLQEELPQIIVRSTRAYKQLRTDLLNQKCSFDKYFREKCEQLYLWRQETFSSTDPLYLMIKEYVVKAPGKRIAHDVFVQLYNEWMRNQFPNSARRAIYTSTLRNYHIQGERGFFIDVDWSPAFKKIVHCRKGDQEAYQERLAKIADRKSLEQETKALERAKAKLTELQRNDINYLKEQLAKYKKAYTKQRRLKRKYRNKVNQ